MVEKHYIEEIGTEILLDTGSILTDATSLTIKCKKPDGTEVEWTAALKDVTKLSYYTVAGDLNLPGRYKLQASIIMPNWTGLGETTDLKVFKSFE